MRRRDLLAAMASAIAAPITAKSATAPAAQQRNEIMDIDIKRAGSRPSGKGPAEWFTGAVRIDPLFQAQDPARANGAHVTLSPAPAPPGIPIRSDRR